MSGAEKQLGVIKDIVLPADIRFRYDVYFTGKRVAIVCMGKGSHFEAEASGENSVLPSAFGVPPITSSYVEKSQDKHTIDKETENWSLDDLLALSKKSGSYNLDEIKEIKLIAGHRLRFVILSEDCESKFSPNQEQFIQLIDILSKTEALRNKLAIAGSWNLLKEIFSQY